MLIVIGVVTGLLAGIWMLCIWALRKADRVRRELLLLGLVLLPLAYFWGADAFAWPTPESLATSTGAVTDLADQRLLAGVIAVTAGVVVAVLVKTGVTRRLKKWSRDPE